VIGVERLLSIGILLLAKPEAVDHEMFLVPAFFKNLAPRGGHTKIQKKQVKVYFKNTSLIH